MPSFPRKRESIVPLQDEIKMDPRFREDDDLFSALRLVNHATRHRFGRKALPCAGCGRGKVLLSEDGRI